ncbi:MAG TPA: C-type lectin domain-containing protein [Kofleriaceae bacterium]|nr:C-type lectin domain-containing protein [Kofleriaceae bacterium]
MRALLLLALLCTGCLRKTEFRCIANDQCNPGGTCQQTGYCSFADTGCQSGQRYGELAGPLADQCVGEQGGSDGGIDGGIDGPPVDGPAAGCPADYAPLASGPTGHLYKKVPQSLSWTQQFDYCRSTSMRAYLAVPNDAAELTNLHALAGGTFWVGINDLVVEGTYVEAELSGPATFLPWAAGQPDNAGGGSGADCVAATATTISDEACSSNRPAACECNP